MKRGDKHTTPAVDFTGTKSQIEATPLPIEGMTALATDNPSAPIGKYLSGSWQWFGGGGTGDVVSPSGSVNGNFSVFDGITGKVILDSGINLALYTDAKDPTGWVDPDGIDISYDSTARTITLTGALNYYWRGRKYSLSSPWVSDAHDSAVGQYYLYSEDGLTFSWSTTVWAFSDIMVAKAIYTTSDKFGLRETHGLMPWQVHEELHETISAFRESGGELTAGTYTENTATDAANSPGFDAAEIQDEDLHTSIPAWTQGTYTTARIGAGSVMVFDTTATLPFRHGASYIYYNTPSTGAETAAANNRYLNVYQIILPATSDTTNSQKYRMLMLQPQAQYTTLTAAQAEDPRVLRLGDLTTTAPEFVIYARITYVTASGDANNGKCRIATGGVSYLAGTKLSQISVSGFVAPTAENVPFAPAGNIAATNVQAAIEELDTEKQAVNTTIPNDGWAVGTGTWSYSSADSPTFVISIDADMTAILSAGMRIKLTQTTVKYFIVTAVGSYSGGATLVTVYGGRDYTLANAAITAPYYSPVKAPFGFPLLPAKWTVEISDTSDRVQASPTANVWYHPSSVLEISLPIGAWKVSYHTAFYASTTGYPVCFGTLSTTNNSESDPDLTMYVASVLTPYTTNYVFNSAYCEKPLSIAAKTLYYMNIKTNQTGTGAIGVNGTSKKTILRALCTYL